MARSSPFVFAQTLWGRSLQRAGYTVGLLLALIGIAVGGAMQTGVRAGVGIGLFLGGLALVMGSWGVPYGLLLGDTAARGIRAASTRPPTYEELAIYLERELGRAPSSDEVYGRLEQINQERVATMGQGALAGLIAFGLHKQSDHL